jgi:hypothetical protein
MLRTVQGVTACNQHAHHHSVRMNISNEVPAASWPTNLVMLQCFFTKSCMSHAGVLKLDGAAS